MKTFITPDIAESGNPLCIVHDTKGIELSENGFYFTAECGSTEECETLSPNGHSARKATPLGSFVSCGECIMKKAGR